MLAISNGAEHISALVPQERVSHVLDLLHLWLVHESQEHIAVAVHEAHLALTGHLNLVKLHLDDLSGMLDLLGSRLARHDVEHSHDLGVHGIDQGKDVTGEGQVSLVKELNSETLVLG